MDRGLFEIIYEYKKDLIVILGRNRVDFKGVRAGLWKIREGRGSSGK